jgi:hypothetical protein
MFANIKKRERLRNRKGLFRRVSKGAGLSLFKRITKIPCSQLFPAEGAKTEARLNGVAAGGTGKAVPFSPPGQDLPGFAGDAPAAPALEEGGPFFDPNYGNKKERKILIHPLEACLIETAHRAHPGGILQGHGLRLYAADKEEHGFLPFRHSQTLSTRPCDYSATRPHTVSTLSLKPMEIKDDFGPLQIMLKRFEETLKATG